ncbi:ribose-phosphate pyrophosphokinase [Paenibacillus pasadenensis]|uniref:ribose-phosphate pyrophosphokinase n=1 Tax=Paenibacillus pasadenensis TaxID=217090 RepID=UPI002041F140|nr:ribose-phosphate pyrophosphokinase [Paenibacillus pasadenensis]MCM3749396.1 ribose-phosphate pyrophosphokinase [Paenibacillus pasadenensis]
MIKLNGEKLNFGAYPNGETLADGEQMLQLAGLGKQEPVQLALHYDQDGDFMQLMFAKGYLADHGFEAELTIAYMPYSRMDRVVGSSVFTLKYAAAFLNSLNFRSVTVVEPHSPVTLELLERSRAVYPTLELLDEVMQDIQFQTDSDVLFFPDAGAQLRYGELSGLRQLVGKKARDFQSGQISKLEVEGGDSLPLKQGFSAIIVDDLCSYGGTFLLSAERLKELGAGPIYLLVAHCERSIFKGKLLQSGLIKRVYATDSMLSEADVEAGRQADVQTEFNLYPIGGMKHD